MRKRDDRVHLGVEIEDDEEQRFSHSKVEGEESLIYYKNEI